MTGKKCFCGAPECWDAEDHAWLSSASGWRGDINGCNTSVFFIHGKQVREQRHVPNGSYQVAELPQLFEKWAEGLPDARLVWLEDAGNGDAGLWIEGVREPVEADWQRYEEASARERDRAIRALRDIRRKFPELLSGDDV